MSDRTLHLSCCLIYLSLCLGSGDAVGQSNDNTVILDHADSLVGREIDGEKARELIGNVQFRQGNVVITCQRAVQFLRRNIVKMEGIVTVQDDSMKLVAQRGTYDANTKIVEGFDRVRLDDSMTTLDALYGKYITQEKKAYFRDNVSFQDTASTLTCDELTYFRNEQKFVADHHVKIVNAKNGLTLHGGHFENYRQRSYSFLNDQPSAMQIDTSESGKIDTLIVTGVTLESYQDSLPRLIATDSVTMSRSAFAAEAGLMMFYTKHDSILLFQQPTVWYAAARGETTQVSGDSMFLKLNQRKLDRLYIKGNSFVASRADSLDERRYHQIAGQFMEIQFEENAIQTIDVEQTATMAYYLYDGGKPNGLNKTTGDHVTMTFDHKKIDQITVNGGVEGQYIPERLVHGREFEYNLPGFQWKKIVNRQLKL